MHNIGAEEHRLDEGTKIAQLILEKISNVTIEEVDELLATYRGSRAFGSTDNNPTTTIPTQHQHHPIL